MVNRDQMVKGLEQFCDCRKACDAYDEATKCPLDDFMGDRACDFPELSDDDLQAAYNIMLNANGVNNTESKTNAVPDVKSDMTSAKRNVKYMSGAEMIDELNAYCNRRRSCTAFEGGEDTDCPFVSDKIKLGTIANDDFEHMNDDQLIECLAKIGIHANLANDEKPNGCIKPDMVAHPPHYNQGGIECIDAIKSATVGKTGIEAVCVANVIKYCWRYEEKNGVEDVKKARWYLDRLIKELEAKA